MKQKSKISKILIIVAFLLVSICLKAELPVENVKLFSIRSKKDTIQFIKIGIETSQAKPIIFYCQGSLPLPLIVKDKGNSFIIATNNFDYRTLLKKYNIIIVSMPHTPVVADKSHLDNKYAYVPNILKPNEYDTQYLADNYLEKYVERGNIVLKYLKKQSWVDKKKIILIGHSQGADVALSLAKQNPYIYALGYFSGSADGRFEPQIIEQRNASKKGKISNEEAQANIEKEYEWWKSVCRDTTEFVPGTADSKRTWKSFSGSDREKLVSLKIPVFITYGTEDVGPQNNDLLPIYFELAGKTNYKMRPFVGCGHNFEEIMPTGEHNYDKMHWNDAVSDFIFWCESL
jgi:hypothetical protein